MNNRNMGTIIGVNHWTDTLFSLQISSDNEVSFIAGQYGKLGFEQDGRRVQRAYSYVNAPSNNQLEFYFVLIPDGKLTPYLHSLKIGDRVQIDKTGNGFFVLREVPNCETLWMLATGTGIGPYLSILQEGLTDSAEANHPLGLSRFKQLVLVHGVRFAADLSYLPLMNQLEKEYQGKLRIQTVVSRESDPNSLLGRIPNLIESGELESSVGLPLNAETSHVMLCGNPKMIQDTRETLLRTRGMTKHLRSKPGHITSEQYW